MTDNGRVRNTPADAGRVTNFQRRFKIDPAVAAGLLLGFFLLIVAGPFVLPRLIEMGAEPGAAREVTYTVPAGTAELIKQGIDPHVITGEMVFTLGVQDVLVIHNDDEVGHTFGPYWVASHNTLRVHFSQPAVYEGYCSVHSSNQVRIVVQRRSS